MGRGDGSADEILYGDGMVARASTPPLVESLPKWLPTNVQAVEIESRDVGYDLGGEWDECLSATVFSRDLFWVYEIPMWELSGVPGSRGKRDDGTSFRIGTEGKGGVEVFFPYKPKLGDLRRPEPAGIGIDGRELDWWSALEEVGKRLRLRRRTSLPPMGP